MDTQTLLTISAIAVTNIGTMLGLFMWATSNTSKETARIENRTDRLIESIATEMKDFHGRLCTIEARAKNLSQGE